MSFTFAPCSISDLYEIQPKLFKDNRGYFVETYNEQDFFEAELKVRFVQDNQSASKGNVLRGLHFQTIHPQGKLVRALQGKILDIAVDLRNPSPTFGKYYSTVLDGEKQNMLYIPQGFAHGFYVISDFAIFTYKCTDFYHPEDEAGIMWNDKNINIDWKSFITEPNNLILSEKDKNYPLFDFNKKYFDMNGKWQGNLG